MAKEVSQKLKVSDYVFEMNNKDIENVYVTYSFGTLTSWSFKEGKIDKTKYLPVINFELSGVDSENREAWISFELRMDLNMLNECSETPTDISKFTSTSEAYIKRPVEDKADILDFWFPQNKFEDIFHNLSSAYVSKVKENVFIFKLSIPNEVFTYFKVDFNE